MRSINKEINDLTNFVFPFEGEKHLCTILMLPYREDTWRNDALPAMEEYLNVVKAISEFELVVVIASKRIPYDIVKRFQLKNTHVLRLEYDDAWARDPLPVFLKNDVDKLLVGVDFGFNAWGGEYNGLYKDYRADNELGKYTLLDLAIQRHQAKDFILEGGSIHTDGEGTLLVTEECLLSKGRNPKLSKEEIEERLKKELNVRKVLWIPYGVYNDETDGHVDNICCFLKPGVVALAYCEDKADEQYERSLKDYEYLSSVTDSQGRKLEIVKIPLPKPMYMTKEESDGIKLEDSAISRLEGRRLAGSYINFYMSDSFIILPKFNVNEDQIAYDILNDFYKGSKKIIQIESREILLGGGNIHCITKQVPYMEGYYLRSEDEKK